MFYSQIWLNLLVDDCQLGYTSQNRKRKEYLVGMNVKYVKKIRVFKIIPRDLICYV